MTTNYHFWRGGDRVEVEQVVSGATAYFPANVVNAPSVRKTVVWVEHETLMVRGSVPMKEYVVPTRLRPSPPSEFYRVYKVGDEVEIFRDSEGCWVRGNVRTVLGNSKYIVEFNGFNRPETEVDRSNLRLHREWVDCSWVPSFPQKVNVLESMPKSIKLKIKLKRRDQYEKGDIVEVRSEEEACKDSWYCARIITLLGEDKYIVQHLRFSRDNNDESIPLRDLVEALNLRPVPPPESSPVLCYEAGDEVDAWFNKRWWLGRVTKVFGGGSKYSVYFSSKSEESIVLYFNLRPHKDWINGQWLNPSKVHEQCYKPPLKKLKPCEREEKKFKFRRTDQYEKGAIVERRSEEECYKPPLKKLKPCEREEKKFKFRRRDQYEKEAVVERRSEEECYKPPLKKLKPCEREEKEFKFNNGMMVEVRSDERGYEGSWFSAKIINYLGEDRYIVEYQTLRTEDEREWLMEEARGSDIRPIPPSLIQRACRYELCEYVDAWFNEGWWSGQVYEIKENYSRYGVYFKTTHEKLEFAYNDLRPSQVWRKGEWTRVSD